MLSRSYFRSRWRPNSRRSKKDKHGGGEVWKDTENPVSEGVVSTTTDAAVHIERMIDPHVRLRDMTDDGRCQECGQ